MRRALLSDLAGDVRACLAFYTRLPVAAADPARGGRSFADAQWAAPLAGAAVGLISGLAYWACLKPGLPPTAAALAAVAAAVLITGALHEDGLADTADGLGDGRTRERRLEIMRDSRIGTYGALALIFSVLMRAFLLAAIAVPGPVLIALVASHAAARALLPAFMQLVPPARTDGLSAGAGAGGPNTASIALALGAAALLPLGHAGAVVAAGLLLALIWAVRRQALAALGGQTGDVLGALEQLAEILVLAVACTVLV